jgi:hypothetical protein
MRIRSLFVFLSLLALCSGVVAQSVTVRPRKVVYKRASKDIPEWKRTFEVRYPTFSGRFAPAALRNLKSGTDYWSLFDTTLADNLKDDHWLSSFDYLVRYNKNNILDLLLIMEGVGAYPDTSIKYLVFDLRTGKKVELQDLFDPRRLDDLRDLIRGKMRSHEAALEGEIKEELALRRESDILPNLHPPPDKLELKNLEGFSVSDTGITFLYDYGYPHVIQALEPSNEFFISYKDLKTLIRTDGLLARFVR